MSLLVRFLIALALAAYPLACQRAGETADDASPAPAESVAGGEERMTPLDGLASAKRLELRTALFTLNKALLDFHVLNDRYPADQRELESAPEVAAAAADVKALVESFSYRAEDGSYRVEITPRGGLPQTMVGSDPTAGAP